MTRNLLTTFAAALAVTAAASAASAQGARDLRDAPHLQVSYTDLNLNTVSGRAQLNRRISIAADTLCGSAPSIIDLRATEAYRTCLQATIATTTQSVQEAVARQARTQPQLAAAAN